MGQGTNPVSDSSFEADVLQANGLVLVDFWAEWCGPCKMIGPVLEELAGEMGDKVRIVKMNVDENPRVPSQYGIRSIPTLILFKNGQVVAQKVGALPKAQMAQWIHGAIAA